VTTAAWGSAEAFTLSFMWTPVCRAVAIPLATAQPPEGGALTLGLCTASLTILHAATRRGSHPGTHWTACVLGA